MKKTIIHIASLALFIALLLVPAMASADSTRTMILVENDTTTEFAGSAEARGTGQGGKLPSHSLTPYIFRDTAYFAKDTEYDYTITISDMKGNLSRVGLVVVNAWALGPEIIRCEVRGIESGIPDTTVTAEAHQDALGSCRCEVRIRSE